MIKTGIFNSINGDRVYNADDLGEYFSGLLSDGVFKGFENEMEPTTPGGVPIVVINSGKASLLGKYVKTNNYDITFKAITQLYNKGYEEFIFASASLDTSSTRVERKNGFIDAIKSIKASSHIVKIEEELSYYDLSKELMKYINTSKKVAIFAAHGKALQKVFKAVKHLKLDVPNKVGIIGFDNGNWTTYASPSVTTIDQQNYQQGKYATKLLIDMIENRESILDSVEFESSIIWKESTDL